MLLRNTGTYAAVHSVTFKNIVFIMSTACLFMNVTPILKMLMFFTHIGIPSFICFLISFWSQVISLLGDVCVVTDCERIVKEVIDYYGQLNVLVSWFIHRIVGGG
jgi:hypothetical protein